MQLAGARPDYTTVFQDKAHMRVKRRIGPSGLGWALLCLTGPQGQLVPLMIPQGSEIGVCLTSALLITG